MPKSNLSVSSYLVNSFLGAAHHDPNLNRQKIIELYNTKPNPPQWLPNVGDHPRVWQRKLNLRELLRFRDVFIRHPDLIHDQNFENDDVVRARSLSGIFCRKEEGDDSYTELFSGMLVPGQSYIGKKDQGTYKVHTCMHGFVAEWHAGQPINEFYFIPYGLPPSDKYAFQVVSVYQNHQVVSQDTINNMHDDHKVTVGNIYNQKDYACVHIHPLSVNEQTLKAVMSENEVQGFHALQYAQKLPSLIGFKGVSRLDNEDFKLFIIGRPTDATARWGKNGFAISTNLTSYQPIARKPTQNDPHVEEPKTAAIPGEYTLDAPMAPGMSGGPVLECWSGDNQMRRRCRIKGVVWGNERIFNKENKLIDLKSIASSVD